MPRREKIKLKRNCTAVLVPWGGQVTLPKGKHVILTQNVGGSFTVEYAGNLYRIDGQNADALGRELPPPPDDASIEASTQEIVEKTVWERLATCYDPEIPINIVALGLIYGCVVTPLESKMGFRVVVEMTLTAPTCGMADYILQDVRDKIQTIPGVASTDVQLVWDPPWSMERMSEEARLEAGLF